MKKSELRQLIKEVLKEELSKQSKLHEHHYPELEPIECENCGRTVSEDEYRLYTNEYEEEVIVCPECYDELEAEEPLDVAASEVDDLARDVFVDDAFEAAYMADGYTVGDAVNQLIVEVISDEYPNTDLGSVPERVSDALYNMIEDGILG